LKLLIDGEVSLKQESILEWSFITHVEHSKTDGFRIPGTNCFAMEHIKALYSKMNTSSNRE
jgi:hypothetical protein